MTAGNFHGDKIASALHNYVYNPSPANLELNCDVLFALTRSKFSVRTLLRLDLTEKERSSGR
jgi:hypothetical protein